jgi:Ca2+:H+ antiporter
VRLVESGGLPRVGAGHGSFGTAADTVSVVLSVALVVLYARGLIASLRRHSEQFEPPADEPRWSASFAMLVLAISAALVAAASDTLVESVAEASGEIGLSQFFIGAIVVAIVGNAAEHYVAVIAAVRDRVDLTLSIAVGSAAQVGLLLAPLIALLSLLVGPAQMPLVFNGYELAGLVAAGALAAATTFDGTSTRRRGAGLLCAYLALGVAFLLA